MLKARIIPTLLWKNFGLVKGTGFDSWRRVGPVLPAVKVYNTRDVDELFLVDILASTERRCVNCDLLRDFADECFVPLTVGGGVTNLEQIRELLVAGADKIAVNSAAYSDPEFIQKASRQFGAQCVVVSIDARRHDDGRYYCYSHAGSRPTGKDVVSWSREVEALGAGEILLTSIERDGLMEGYDLGLIEQVAARVNVPLIASGGAGTYEHMREAIQEAGASAVAAGSMFHFTEQTPAEAKRYLAAAGVPVRSAFRPVPSQP